MLVINKLSRVPIYEQIINGIHREILLGLLKPGDQLPSIRELAVKLSTNPNTIQKSFIELDRQGVIISSPGKGCFVAENAQEIIKEGLYKKLSDIKSLTAELAMGGIPEEEILKAVREAYGTKGETT